MAYYRICPNCSATLDPGENCDCIKDNKNQLTKMEDLLNGNCDQNIGNGNSSECIE